MITMKRMGQALLTLTVALFLGGWVWDSSTVRSRTVVVYDNESIEGNRAIWKQEGIPVAGYRYANVFVEFEQKDPAEEPLSMGVGFAPWRNGRAGTRRYYNLEHDPCSGPAVPGQDQARQPIWISGNGRDCWHGEQGINSYAVRVPVLGPYMWVYPLNELGIPRHFTVAVYLSQ